MERALVVDRIRRLLALSTSSNIHEAALALQKAQWLMDKYAIDHEAVLPPIEERMGMEASEPQADHGNSPPWLRQLHAMLADLFGGLSLIDPADGQFYFVGDRDDFPLMRHFFVYLQRQIRLWTYRWQQKQIAGAQPGQVMEFSDADRESYAFGLVFSLTQRLETLTGRREPKTTADQSRPPAEEEETPTRAELVELSSLRERKRTAARNYLLQTTITTRKSQGQTPFSFQQISFSEGKRDSYNIELHTPVAETDANASGGSEQSGVRAKLPPSPGSIP